MNGSYKQKGSNYFIFLNELSTPKGNFNSGQLQLNCSQKKKIIAQKKTLVHKYALGKTSP